MPDIKLSDSELLKYAVENGIIDAALLQDKIEMQKRKELLKKHPYSIWEGKMDIGTHICLMETEENS